MSNVERLTFPLARVVAIALILITGSLTAGQYISKVEHVYTAYEEQKIINKEILNELRDIKIQLAHLVGEGKNNGR